MAVTFGVSLVEWSTTLLVRLSRTKDHLHHKLLTLVRLPIPLRKGKAGPYQGKA